MQHEQATNLFVPLQSIYNDETCSVLRTWRLLSITLFYYCPPRCLAVSYSCYLWVCSLIRPIRGIRAA
jgi:hypothetical protein